jgi:hypothetical protein
MLVLSTETNPGAATWQPAAAGVAYAEINPNSDIIEAGNIGDTQIFDLGVTIPPNTFTDGLGYFQWTCYVFAVNLGPTSLDFKLGCRVGTLAASSELMLGTFSCPSNAVMAGSFTLSPFVQAGVSDWASRGLISLQSDGIEEAPTVVPLQINSILLQSSANLAQALPIKPVVQFLTAPAGVAYVSVATAQVQAFQP